MALKYIQIFVNINKSSPERIPGIATTLRHKIELTWYFFVDKNTNQTENCDVKDDSGITLLKKLKPKFVRDITHYIRKSK